MPGDHTFTGSTDGCSVTWDVSGKAVWHHFDFRGLMRGVGEGTKSTLSASHMLSFFSYWSKLIPQGVDSPALGPPLGSQIPGP